MTAMSQFNLYYTDEVSENNHASQHNCFLDVTGIYGDRETRNLMSYCMSELPSKFDVQENEIFPKLTFDQLSKENITSEQLYQWSAPMDIIENYQFYLNQLSTSNHLILAQQVYYNCTLPRLGPQCQYEFYSYDPNYSSVDEVIRDFYYFSEYDPTNFTCYIHLECNRGPSPSCLDWSEICNGQIDCLDSGIDEEHCWQLEINECRDDNDEYRCANGQCIPKSFYQDGFNTPDCMDRSDDISLELSFGWRCDASYRPTIGCEDRICQYTPLTSSCVKQRSVLLLDAMHSSKHSLLPQNCWSAFKCILQLQDSEYSSDNKFCENNTCIKIINESCPELIFFPNAPILFGNIYFAYRKYDLVHSSNPHNLSFYICYNKSYYDEYMLNIPKILFNNMTCICSDHLVSRLNGSLKLSTIDYEFYQENLLQLFKMLKRYDLNFNYNSTICNRSNMYQCIRSSKCISSYRFIDGIYDCPHMDDENMTAINTMNVMEQINKIYFKCEVSNKYILRSLVSNYVCDCEEDETVWCEDEDLEGNEIRRNISFQNICDGFNELLPIMIEGRNETDETECEQWECDNVYTHYNGEWNCPKGDDEIGYVSYSTLNCSSKQHLCVLPNTNQLTCLSMEKVNDGNVDCLGATDEPTLCKRNILSNLGWSNKDFYCMNFSMSSCISNFDLCDGYKQCENGDDEQVCTNYQTLDEHYGMCLYRHGNVSDVQKFLCDNSGDFRRWKRIDFKLNTIIESTEDRPKNIESQMFSKSFIIQMSDKNPHHCHRGFNLGVWLNNNTNNITNTCLCPPSYYGDQCQYQNQRISLTTQFRALSDSLQTIFTIVISLIDDSDKRIIHSYQQFTYLSIRDCITKFNSYLLYSQRPKDSTKNYAIHIDIYEKISLNYRGSLLLPVTFPFLPVHRLAFIIDIPPSDHKTQSCSNHQCIHGNCIKYSNNPQNLTFCQCNEGWSGKYCHIQHTCKCSNDSLCLGISANNRSICVCPLNKFGPRCLLTDTICQKNDNSTCQNNGQCIPNDENLLLDQEFVCICPKGFSRDRCEIPDTKLILSFNTDILFSQSLFIHFFEINYDDGLRRSTTFRTIPIRQDSITIYWTRPFHLVFTELSGKNYYLTVIENVHNQSSTINKTINPSDHCPNISELFNHSFIQLHLIRRIKYYHLPCQNQSLNLSCFHDDVHLCLCYDFQRKRLANCFKFEHNMKFDCRGQNICENDGQCLQDIPNCPKTSMCICRECFYGRRCQFKTSGFGLSLDAILGYHILPHVSFTDQPFIIKISLTFTIIFMIIGLINSICTMITFKNKTVREVGCGLYLLSSSITTLLTTTMFGLKFFILLLSQMSTISNKSFLVFQCHSFDFLLRVCLSMDQWLNACVALERAMTIIKGASFDKKKSKQTAKFVIILLLVVIISTSIHDPIYRRLIDEENESDDVKRIWCIITYSSNLQIYNYIIYCCHFFGPFIINFVSAIILIIKKSRQQSTIHTRQTYKEILREQVQKHKHLLIAPIVLVILALPRLIITFISKCMKSANHSWLFLVGYFISYIPPMLTFIIFVLPSKFYKKEFRKTIHQYRSTIQRRLHRN